MIGGPCDRSRDAQLDPVEKGGPRSPIPPQGEEQLARLRICLAESDKADLRPGSSRQIQSLVDEVVRHPAVSKKYISLARNRPGVGSQTGRLPTATVERVGLEGRLLTNGVT